MKKLESWFYNLAAVLGGIAYLRGLSAYYQNGYSPGLWVFWLIGCLCIAVVLFRYAPRRRPANGLQPWWARGDWLTLALLLLVFAPLYMVGVHDFPRQMNTDEVAIMNAERVMSADPATDIYGPGFYSDLPAFIFWFMGRIGMAIGGVDLANMRLVHAGSGVLIILLTFVLLRLLQLPRAAALAGTVTIGVCHSLFFLSRMAMRDNTALLFMLIAFILLWYAWQRRHAGWGLLGGFAGGLTWYTYYPSRITLVVWGAFMLAVVVWSLLSGRRIGATLRAVLAVNAAALLGAAMIMAPLFVANSKHIPTDPYPTQQFLWQPEARDQERRYRGVATEKEALRINMLHGLAMFNVAYDDQAMIYINKGHGFVDKVTGVLIWGGIIAVLAYSIRRKRLSQEDAFALVGFFGIYLSMAFLLTKAPNYTRLLIILPFVAYLVARLVQVVASARPLARRAWGQWAVAGAVIVAVAFANGLITYDFWRQGAQQGDGVGDTHRFQEARAHETAEWLFVYGTDLYFYWGIPDYWRGWLEFPKGETQPLSLVPMEQLAGHDTRIEQPGGHGYLLATGAVWDVVRPEFEAKQRIVSVTPLDPAGNRVAVRYTNY